MDVTRQQQLQNDIAARFAASLEGLDWAEATLFLLEVGSVARLWVDATDATGSARQVGAVPDVSALGSQLREAMADPEKGAWFSLSLTVSSDGSFTARFNYDRRVWVDPASPFEPGDAVDLPGDDDYAADLARFPRADRYRPEWLPEATGAGGPDDPARASSSSVVPSALEPLLGRWGWPGVVASVEQQVASSPAASTAETVPGGDGSVPALTLAQLSRGVREAVVSDVIEPHRVATLLRLHTEAVDAGVLPVVADVDQVDPDRSVEEARVVSPAVVPVVEAAVSGLVDAIVAEHLQAVTA